MTTRLLRERKIAWGDLRDARDGPFGTRIIRLKRGLPIVIWPYLEDFHALNDAVNARPRLWVGAAERKGPTQP